MRKFLFITILFCGSLVISQTQFLPHKNTEWHYNFSNMFSSAITNVSLKYVRDSVIGSEIAKVIVHTKYFRECNNPGTVITLLKQQNDSVFFRNAVTLHQWQLLINYSAVPGQNWSFTTQNYNNTLQTFTVTVDSVNYVTINNFSLKRMFVKYSTYNSLYSFAVNYNSTIYERFGDNNYLFNFMPNSSPLCDADYTMGIICYQDSTFGLKQFTTKPCNYFTTGIEAGTPEDKETLLYPNPANDYLLLTSSFINKIQLLDLFGKVMISKENILNKEKIKINTTDLKEGVYLLRITGQNDFVTVRKIIIER